MPRNFNRWSPQGAQKSNGWFSFLGKFLLRKNGWKYRTKISQVEGFGKGTIFWGDVSCTHSRICIMANLWQVSSSWGSPIKNGWIILVLTMASGGGVQLQPFQADMAERYAHLQGFVKACWGFVDAGVVRCYWMPGNLRYLISWEDLSFILGYYIDIRIHIRWDDGRSTFVCFFLFMALGDFLPWLPRP